MKKAFVFVGVVTGALATGIALVAPQLRNANILATHSAAASLQHALAESEAGDEFAADWRVLSNTEYDNLLIALTNAEVSLDACPRCYTPDGIFGDAWGERFQIAVRRTGDGGREFIVWSKGPDGRPRTDDDIIVPENRFAEVRKFGRVGSE